MEVPIKIFDPHDASGCRTRSSTELGDGLSRKLQPGARQQMHGSPGRPGVPPLACEIHDAASMAEAAPAGQPPSSRSDTDNIQSQAGTTNGAHEHEERPGRNELRKGGAADAAVGMLDFDRIFHRRHRMHQT